MHGYGPGPSAACSGSWRPAIEERNTPLHLAVAASRKDTVQVLVTLGADLKAKNQLGETPVATGERCGTNSEVLSFLQTLMGLVDPPQ